MYYVYISLLCFIFIWMIDTMFVQFSSCQNLPSIEFLFATGSYGFTGLHLFLQPQSAALVQRFLRGRFRQLSSIASSWVF